MAAGLEGRALRVQRVLGAEASGPEGVLHVGPDGVAFRDDAGREVTVAVADILGASTCRPGAGADFVIEGRERPLHFTIPAGSPQPPAAIVAAIRRAVAAQFGAADEVRIGTPPPTYRSAGPHVVLAIMDLTWGDGDTTRLLMVEVSTLMTPYAWKRRAQLSADLHQRLVEGIGAIADDPRDESLVARLGVLLMQNTVTAPGLAEVRKLSPSILTLRVDELLAHLPWGILFDGSRYPLLDFATAQQIVTIQSIRPPPRARRPARLRILLIANPAGDLPAAEAEARAIERSFRGLAGVPVEVVSLFRERADRLNVLSALSGERWDIVHYAGHSVFDTSDGSGSAWCLTGGELSTVEIVQNTASLPPSLVYSSSCESSREDDRRRLGYDKRFFGLASAFLHGGVRSYVGSFWPVHDTDAAALARRFYAVLLGGKPVAEALRAARDALAKRGRSASAWGGIMLFGDPSYKLPRGVANVTAGAAEQSSSDGAPPRPPRR